MKKAALFLIIFMNVILLTACCLVEKGETVENGTFVAAESGNEAEVNTSEEYITKESTFAVTKAESDAEKKTYEEKFVEQVKDDFPLEGSRYEDSAIEYIKTNNTTGIGICLTYDGGGVGHSWFNIYVTLNGWKDWEKGNNYIRIQNGGHAEFTLVGNRFFVFEMGGISCSANVAVYEIDESTRELICTNEHIEVPSLEQLKDGEFDYIGVYPQAIYNDNEKAVVVWKAYSGCLSPTFEGQYNHEDEIVAISEYDSDFNETVIYKNEDDDLYKRIIENHQEY